MPLDFPSNPSVNDTYSNSGRTWKWNGSGWELTANALISSALIQDDAVTYAKIQNVSATDKLLGRSSAGAGDIEEITCTAAGRALLDDADAAAQRTTLGLGTLATQSGTFSGTSSGTNTGDQTITLTGDVTGSGTGSFATAIAAGVIVDADVSASAEISVSKLADGAARQLLQTDAAGTGVEWTSNVDLPGTLDVTGVSTFDSNIVVPSINSGPLAGFRNAIINGDMRIWQRGTSGFTSGYTVDRWYLNGANAASRSTDVPSGFQYSLSFSIASGTICGASQRIESVNATELASQSVTVSFWFKRTGAAGNLQVNLDYPTAVDDYTGTGAIGATQVAASPSTSWTYYSVTFPSINANAANGLMVTVFSTSGSNASLGGLLTGIQLEVGPVATPFERRPIGTELALCQRYYETSGATFYGQASLFRGYVISGSTYTARTYFNVQKRATPTVTITNEFATAFPTTPGAPQGGGPRGFGEDRVANANNNSGFFSSYWTADAEL